MPTILGIANANRHAHTTSWCIAPLSISSGSDTPMSPSQESLQQPCDDSFLMSCTKQECQQPHHPLQGKSDDREDGVEDGIRQREEEREYHHNPIGFCR